MWQMDFGLKMRRNVTKGKIQLSVKNVWEHWFFPCLNWNFVTSWNRMWQNATCEKCDKLSDRSGHPWKSYYIFSSQFIFSCFVLLDAPSCYIVWKTFAKFLYCYFWWNDSNRNCVLLHCSISNCDNLSVDLNFTFDKNL